MYIPHTRIWISDADGPSFLSSQAKSLQDKPLTLLDEAAGVWMLKTTNLALVARMPSLHFASRILPGTEKRLTRCSFSHGPTCDP